jgi:TonB-dependent starch-binding outer membrane protein SusC
MKLTALLLFLFLVSLSVAGSSPQQQMVTGTVTDATTTDPLPGVHVIIEGTLNGTATDLNGRFALPKPENGAVLVFSFVGYVTEKIAWSGQTVIDVKLSQNVHALDEVVVIGYGTIKKSDLTGSVASVSINDIEKETPPVNIESVLQGRVAGLMVTSNSGDPGSEGTILIRGIGTVNNNSPIYVVDGMIIDNNNPNDLASNISFLNPADIASIDVLKDASAEAIYGSRGANGVILITTKKGTEGAPKVTFSSSIGFESVARIANVLNATEYKDYVLTSNYNGYMRTHPDANPNILPDTLNSDTKAVVAQYHPWISTNWLDEVLRKNVLSQNYDFSVSGGTKDIHYLASADYTDKGGVMIYSDYKRYSFRLNTDFKAGKYVTFGENLGISSSAQLGDWNWSSIIRNAMTASPLDPVLKHPWWLVDKTDPNYEYDKYSVESGTSNPLLTAVLLNLKKSYFTIVGNMFAEATIFKEFKLHSSWGFNIANNGISNFSPEYYVSPTNQSTISTLTESNFDSNGWVWENTLTYNKKLNDNSITALLGYTSEYSKATSETAEKQGTPNNEQEMQTFDAATVVSNITGGYNVYTMNSYFGRINYSFRDKYLLTASIRRDGSSKFGEGHQWGTFPSFSLGWRINNENFFKDLNAEVISNLKLRAGWGEIGNSSLPIYNAYVSQVASNLNLTGHVDNRYIFGGIVNQGYALSTIGTPDISWETTEQTNFGMEISILKNSLSLTADYYIKNTRNMLLQVPTPNYAGYFSLTAPYSNAGSVQNKGFEFVLNWQGKRGDFSYSVAVNGSSFKNVVTSLGQGNKPLLSGVGSDYPCRTEVGHPIGSFYGYVTNGIYESEYSVQSETGVTGQVMQPNGHTGDFRFLDLNADGKIDANDQRWIGNPWPKLTYGFNINFGYKAFDLVVFFQGSYGNDIYDQQRQYLNSLGIMYSEYYYKNAWRENRPSDTQPILTTVQLNDNYRNSNYYVEDGSYLRLKNIQIGYNLSKEICEKVKISNCRIWVGGTNLLTLTKYRGNDPEVGATNTPIYDAGWDKDGYLPKQREMSLGITISF